ncbi:MAG: hypothetical protein COS71_01220 [Candidatus Moranbacteria bacterium CG06_land_8_20_14_3_00_40_12]|nr:MAG: hypothetical protein COX31_01665 [Candidatus Moranbacteria bacterium CG23_combo_of_CG06-09_8_20_14_all_40_16]PIU80824.1 MAG: hypothetical protein COS71_01220 [Candidatus Moranbacteria bacterium CG06_land_8_20_14_3_00_40_12]
MKRKILDYSLAFLTLLFSVLFWRAVDQAMINPAASVWLMPIIWFSLFATLFFLDLTVIKVKYLIFFTALGSFLGELFFFPIFNIISFLIEFLVIWRVRGEIAYGSKINLRRIIRSGALMFILAWSFAVASHYYLVSQKNEMANPILKFKLEGMAESITFNVLSRVNPSFQKIKEENLTVDQFIAENQYPSAIKAPEPLEEMKQALIMDESRKKLSEIAGIYLSGEEKIMDVISQIINQKIVAILPTLENNQGNFSPIFLAVAAGLFFSLVALGSVLLYVWIALAYIIFYSLLRIGLIRLSYMAFEREILD